MSLREFAGKYAVGFKDEPYFTFNHEERHLSAVVFYLLNLNHNAEHLLKGVGCNWDISPTEFGVYFEYSYARDLWKKLSSRERSKGPAIGVAPPREINDCKQSIILDMLRENDVEESELEKLSRSNSIEEFNSNFIGRDSAEKDRASKRFIQSPAKWNLSKLEQRFKDNEKSLQAACNIKWAFNVKPDIVIHADREHALCLELKLESGLGAYGTRKGGPSGRQLDVQEFLMKKVLRFSECRFFLISSPRPRTVSCDKWISWEKLLGFLDLPVPVPRYMKAALEYAESRK